MHIITPTDPIYAALATFLIKYCLAMCAALLVGSCLVAIVRHMARPRRKAEPWLTQLFK